MSERTAKITIEYVIVDKRTIEASGKGLARIEKALKPYLMLEAFKPVVVSIKPAYVVRKKRGKPGPKPKLLKENKLGGKLAMTKRKYKHSDKWIAKHKKAGATGVALDAGSIPALARGSSVAEQRNPVGAAKTHVARAPVGERNTPRPSGPKPKMKPNPKAFPDAVYHDHTLERDLKQAVKLKEDGEFETDEEDAK
jgi:hypothetical protein